MSARFPARYEKVSVLGSGGGGQVWAVRDRLTNETVALKALAEGATEREVQALVREAVTLSGLEGLGVPKVLRFGRLPGSKRPFMVRELVQGQSLLGTLENAGAQAEDCLDIIAQAADQLTGLHRAGLLHGDVKPANIIVSAGNRATLVDLGLAAPWREGGIRPEGLTPRYAAPELFAGLRLTVRAEVFALGASLEDVLDICGDQLAPDIQRALRQVAARATHEDPTQRYPSADEFGSATRHAARIHVPTAQLAVDASWPVVGVDAAANRLLTLLQTLAAGGVVAIDGKTGTGRTVLVRRVAWTLGVEGRDVAWVDERGLLPPAEALELELSACSLGESTVVLVDGADNLPPEAMEPLTRAQQAGCKLVLVASAGHVREMGMEPEVFSMTPLPDDAAANLVRKAIPALPDSLVTHVVSRAEGRPGKLRGIVRRIGTQAVVSAQDVDRLTEESSSATALSVPPPSSLMTVEALLDQGKFEEAAAHLPSIAGEETTAAAMCRARLALGRGDAREALDVLLATRDRAQEHGGTTWKRWLLQAARAHLRLGKYQESAEHAREAASQPPEGKEAEGVTLEALACLGLAQSYGGKHDEAKQMLEEAASRAEALGNKRVEAVVHGSLAVALQRADKLTDARLAYEKALGAAEQAGDAGAVANTQLNLAVLAHGEGDLAGASRHLEAAIDMGRRAGRGSTMRQALLNLANLDIYLGRYVRARSSLAALNEQREHLSPTHRAQLIGLEAELAARTGEPGRAAELYETCAFAWQALDRQVDSAEARLESVLISAWSGIGDPIALSRTVEQVAETLGESTAHRTQLLLARGAVAAAQNEEQRSRDAYDAALAAAKAAGQKEWIWRTLEARARLRASMGQDLAARRDSEEALAVLEEIAGRLPRDLREVYWDDPRRRAVRMTHLGTVASARARSLPMEAARGMANLTAVSPRAFPAGMSSTVAALPAEERLTRLLEINRELAREHNLERLLERVTDHAITLVNAERGFVILAKDGDLVVHTSRSRAGDDVHARFSRSIAEKVVAGGEPVVTLSARDDDRMADYVSVHQLNVQSVACVPIRAPDNRTAGALYVETRLRPGALFHAELPTLAAFADQAAVAIENAHLLAENKARADELAATNAELLKARKRLKELLGHRTAQLESTRRDLDATRAVLRGHFGYHGLVGTSERMRRVYALIDRVKDMAVPVLITGESGTGKEVVARAIHASGPRTKKPFTGVNCGAIPEHLLESELFGHVRGAFTGADRDRKGLFRESEGGTILLDEIGEMPQKMQAGLLRVLQDHLVRPVGGVREESVDCRVIAATNRDLDRMVADGTFREDLFYRLHVVEVRLPPLRERADDIPMLIDHFLQIFATRYRRDRKTISRDALRFLCSCPWPGNVRQLENTLLNAWVMSDRPELELEDFELAGLRPGFNPQMDSSIREIEDESESGAVSRSPRRTVDASLSAHQATEKERILAALSACNWNRVKAAEVVGIPRRTFYRRLAKYGIQ